MSDDELQAHEWLNNSEDDTPPAETEHVEASTLHPTPSTNVIPPPLRKRQKLDVPARFVRKKAQEVRSQTLQKGLVDIEKLIASKRTEFDAGRNGLQAYRARSIRSCLHMVINNHRTLIEASERAAESQGFAARWGGRMVRQWIASWIKFRQLPKSERGRHTKVFSLLDDPEVVTELRSFLRTNKWSMDPQKLSAFTKEKLLPDEAKKYLHRIVEEEMPAGLKKYLEVELFPRIQMKLSVAPGERKLVLVAHDEMTAQANDGKTMSWVWQGEQPLKKKGVGRGLHQSDVICSTVGWLKDASQTLEYGKNYDGYWNGELFVKQLTERIIPAFERAHGPLFQALIMVDNSQGHSAYSVDALLTSRMNMRPGGKQATMRDGWYIMHGERITQRMCFPSDHPEIPAQPKGMRQKYLRENCDYRFPTLQENMPDALASVSVETIRKWEHRMKRWMEAYKDGLGAKDAQIQVKKFSSKHYTSHRRVPEHVAAALDA
ncbi:hypothetical protein M378DRAFT_1031360 [Amanita muscaria Koide BX008]|uniref:Uncharacterized protein n=1 Tax=Amanita muscaria (strain Koide BX008) TaxID=946122 RepID=A0A0C2WLQ7_AMAMK|nr:hypothetical protein M378DRAFT_1031360 [Amanita muscaria Koide BX008]